MTQKRKIRVGVIFGGRSGEHEVSLVSARSIINALDKKKYDVVPLKINKNGSWACGGDVFRKIQSLDVAFPVVHGSYGEDGALPGLLEMANVPYVGCGITASANCMDKFMSKLILAQAGLPVVPFVHVQRSEINNSKIQTTIFKKIGLPCFVKPANLGSSVGISKVKKKSELKKALAVAAQYDTSIIVEKGIDAREIECAVLGNEHPIVSVAGEIIPSREFYDYYAKYVDGSSKTVVPAHLTKKEMSIMQKNAIHAYTVMQCSGMARIDFLLDRKTGAFYLNELNSPPGFTSISMYPKLFAASGLSYPKLLDRLIQLAFARFREKSKTRVSFSSGSDWYTR